MPLSPGHLDWMAYVNDETGKAGVELDLCVLEYGNICLHGYHLSHRTVS